MAEVLRRRPGAGTRARPPATPALRERDFRGAARRSRHHLLHVGDHRQPQGCDAHARQRHLRRRDVHGGGGRPADRRVPGLPAHGVGRRRHLYALREPGRRLHRELGPTTLLAPPRIWENMLTGVLVRAADTSPLKRWIFERSRKVAERVEILRADGKPIPLGLRLRYALGNLFVYTPVRDQLGLRRTRWALTGGAPLGPDTFRFFRSIGVNLKQVYGSTETTGLVSLQPDHEANPNSAGRPCQGIEVRIADKGEVLVRGAGIFKGYYRNEEATREVVDPDGWYRTGDAGFIDPRGHLVIIDRAKAVGALSDGTPFAPQFIENKLKFSPYIREAVAFGHDRPFVTAMIAIDLSTVGNWAERRGLAYTSYADLSQKPEIRALIRDEIAKCNATLPEGTRIRRFLLLTKDLDADDAEITRTRKVRRRFVAEKYAAVVDAFFSGKAEVAMTTTVTYEDGRQASIQSRARIEDVEGAPVHV